MSKRIHLRLDRVTPMHITESIFMDGRFCGQLTFDHGEYQLFGAALLLGSERMQGNLTVEVDPIAHDAEGNFASSHENERQFTQGNAP